MSDFPEEHSVPVTFKTDFKQGSAGETLMMPSDIDLTGKECNCVIVSPNALRSVLPATVGTDGTYAYITTTETTFPYAGTYQIELQSQEPGDDTTTNKADTFTIEVLAAL